MLQTKTHQVSEDAKGRNRGMAHTGNKVSFGEYGLKATGRGRITARQIEAARRTMTRRIKRGGKIWIRSSRTSRFRKSRLRFVWARARALLSTGSLR